MDMWLELICMMDARRVQGIKKYGQPVNADESIDWLTHAEEEFLDGAVYCRAAKRVLESMRAEIAKLREENNALKARMESV